MSISPLRSPSWAADRWAALVAREVERQRDIEARELSGGLSPVGSAQRARIAREFER
jgi:hypothetical protein